MSAVDFNFTDQDELIDFLMDGDSWLVADYLDQNQIIMTSFFEEVSGVDINVPAISAALRSDNDNHISKCRSFISNCLDKGGDRLPLPTPQVEPEEPVVTPTRQTTPEPSAQPEPIAKRALNLKWPLIGVGAIAAAVTVISISTSLFNSEDIAENISPTNDGEISEPFNGVASTQPEPGLSIVNGEVRETLSPSEHDYAQATEFNSHGVEGLHQDTEGTIYYQDWIVPNNVYEANILTAEITGLPLSYMFAAQATESAVNGVIDPNATNTMRTCGLSQFVPSTLAEYGYKYSNLIGFDGIRDDLIVRTRTRLEQDLPNGQPAYNLHYDFANPMARYAVEQACFDPHFNTRLGAVMKLRDIGAMQRNLEHLTPEEGDYFPVTELHAYVALYAGRSGAENLIEDLVSNEGSTAVTTFFDAAARNNETNQWILYHTKPVLDENDQHKRNDNGEIIVEPDTSNPRTVAEFFQHLEETRPLTNTVLPNFTNWDAIRTTIEANMTELERTTVRVTSLRPVPRPEGLRGHMSDAVTSETESTDPPPSPISAPTAPTNSS